VNIRIGGGVRDLIKVFKALSDEIRIRMLKLLLERESLCVCEIMQALNISQTRASRNLGILKDVGFLKDEREGLWVHYSIDEEFVNDYCFPIAKLLKNWLNDDKKVIADRKRLSKAVKLGQKSRC